MYTDLILIQIADAIKSLDSNLYEQIVVTLPSALIGSLVSWFIYHKSRQTQLYIYKQSNAQKIREEFLKWFDELYEIRLTVTDAHQNIEQHIFNETFKTLPDIIHEHIHNITRLQNRVSLFIVDDELTNRTQLLVNQLKLLHDSFTNFEDSSEFDEFNNYAKHKDTTKENFTSSIYIRSDNEKTQLINLKKHLIQTLSEIEITTKSKIIQTYKDTDLIMKKMR